MAVHVYVPVARYEGYCVACDTEQPLILTAHGPRGLRSWLAGLGVEDRALSYTCRVCGRLEHVPATEEDDVAYDATLLRWPDFVPVPAAMPTAPAYADFETAPAYADFETAPAYADLEPAPMVTTPAPLTLVPAHVDVYATAALELLKAPVPFVVEVPVVRVRRSRPVVRVLSIHTVSATDGHLLALAVA